MWLQVSFAETGGRPYCPRCGALEPYHIKTRDKFRCRECKKEYSPTSETLFAYRKKSYRDIIAALFEFSFGADACSAGELSGRIKISYQTAWVWAGKFRELMSAKAAATQFEGPVAIDGAVNGGRARRSNITKKGNASNGRISAKKFAWVAIKSRGPEGQVWAKTFKHEADAALTFIKTTIARGSEVYADEGSWWNVLNGYFAMKRIRHREVLYTPEADTNTVESFFATMRTAGRIYRSVRRKYSDLYLAEQCWRRNTYKSKLTNRERFFGLLQAVSVKRSSDLRGYWQCVPEGDYES